MDHLGLSKSSCLERPDLTFGSTVFHTTPHPEPITGCRSLKESLLPLGPAPFTNLPLALETPDIQARQGGSNGGLRLSRTRSAGFYSALRLSMLF